MKTLILSLNTGQGHNSCAKAIQEAYTAHGEVCGIVDAMAFISPEVSDWMCSWFVRMYRYAPRLFRDSYRYAEHHPGLFEARSAVQRFLGSGNEALYQHICREEYDAVICPHVLSALMLTELLERHPMKLATGFVATDYTCSPAAQQSRLERYFIPHRELREAFVCPNIPPERCIVSGIPVRQAFRERTDPMHAKASFGIMPHRRHLLVMCGSMGCGPMRALVREIKLPEGCEMTVVCGTNRKLYRSLAAQYQSRPEIHIRGYVEDVSRLMDSADLYLTKPGGLSITEAAVKQLPMVFVDAVDGCESYNCDWFWRRDGAETADTVQDISALCTKLLTDDERRAAMQTALRRMQTPDAPEIIYRSMHGEEIA